MKRLDWVVGERCELKKFLMQKGLDFLCVQKLFRKRDIKVNGRRLSQSVMLEVGDKVEALWRNTPKEVA